MDEYTSTPFISCVHSHYAVIIKPQLLNLWLGYSSMNINTNYNNNNTNQVTFNFNNVNLK